MDVMKTNQIHMHRTFKLNISRLRVKEQDMQLTKNLCNADQHL